MYENIALLMGIAFGAFLLDVVLNSAFLWIASKILKLEKQDRSTAVKTAAVYSIVSIVLSAVAFLPSLFLPGGPLITMLLLVLFAIVGLGLYIYLIKRFYEVEWKTALLAFLIAFVASIVISIVLYVLLVLVGMILGVALWQLGVFNVGQGGTEIIGFVKMQPLSPSVEYRGSRFNVAFVNALGAAVNITDIDVKESLSGTTCSVEPLKDQSVRAGNTYVVTGDCGQKNEGDLYDLVFTISYSAKVGGISTTHADTGHIKGSADA